MFAIKVALVVVGIFIVLATGFIALEIYHRLGAPRNIDLLTGQPGTSKPGTSQPGTSELDGVAARIIDLAPGLRIESLATAGNYITFLARQGESHQGTHQGAGSIYIFDPHRLEIIAIISANPPSSSPD